MKRRAIPLAMAALFAFSAPAIAAGERTGLPHGGMHQGMSSDHVRELQQALQAKGHNVGPIDGIMGPQTQSALRDYQRAQGYDATGRFDDRTRAGLGVNPSASGMSPGTPPSGSAPSTLGTRPEDRQPGTSERAGDRQPGMGSRPEDRQPGIGTRPEDRQPGTLRSEPMGSAPTGSTSSPR